MGLEDKQEGQDFGLDTVVFWHVVSHPLKLLPYRISPMRERASIWTF